MLKLILVVALIILIGTGVYAVYFLHRKNNKREDGSDFEILEE